MLCPRYVSMSMDTGIAVKEYSDISTVFQGVLI